MSLRSSHQQFAPLAFACITVSTGCTFLLNHDKQCSSDRDCAHFSPSARCVQEVCVAPATGAGNGADASAAASNGNDNSNSNDNGNDWSCLGHVVWPPRGAANINIAMTFFDFIEQASVTSGFVVRPCSKMDINCSSPLAPAVGPDQRGVAIITAPSGFDGYAEVTGVNTTGDGGLPKYAPTLVFFNPPPVADTNNTMTAMFSPDALAVLARSNGNEIDPTLGSLASGAFDCNGRAAEGVSLEPDRTVESTRRFYYVDGLPNFAAPATDSAGYGGLINLPTGTIRLTAKLQATGRAVASVSVFIRAGHLSQVDVTPTP